MLTSLLFFVSCLLQLSCCQVICWPHCSCLSPVSFSSAIVRWFADLTAPPCLLSPSAQQLSGDMLTSLLLLVSCLLQLICCQLTCWSHCSSLSPVSFSSAVVRWHADLTAPPCLLSPSTQLTCWSHCSSLSPSAQLLSGVMLTSLLLLVSCLLQLNSCQVTCWPHCSSLSP